MKQPRINDFLPDTQAKPLKSSMDDLPAIQKPPKPLVQTPHTLVQPQDPRTPVPSVRPVPVLPTSQTHPTTLNSFGRRKIKSRHPFDIYEDQVDALKQLSIEDRINGGIGSMSAMVREAIDDYLLKKKK